MLEFIYRVLRAISHFSCGQFALVTAAEETAKPVYNTGSLILLVLISALCFVLSVTEWRADARISKRAGGRK